MKNDLQDTLASKSSIIKKSTAPVRTKRIWSDSRRRCRKNWARMKETE